MALASLVRTLSSNAFEMASSFVFLFSSKKYSSKVKVKCVRGMSN